MFKASYEVKFTPFEVGAAAWMCEATRVPSRLVQTQVNQDINDGLTGRSIKFRDWFAFPEDVLNEMEVDIPISISEPVLLRISVGKSDFDVHMKLAKDNMIACTTNKVV